MINRHRLVGALTARKVAEWTLTERVLEIAMLDEGRPLRRTEERTRFQLVVHHDTSQGRGTARLAIGGVDGDPADVVEQAIRIATSSLGPAWRSRPPAAPAKVAILDPALATADLAKTAAEIVAALPRPPTARVTAEVELVRERVAVDTHAGFHTSWAASEVSGRVHVAIGDHSLEVARDARRIADLELGRAITDAVTDLQRLATAASAPRPGRCALILRTDAFLHGDGLGVWSVFSDHANAELERHGLTRYRLRAPISPGSDQVREPLSLTSNGALDFGSQSAPVSDEGEAVRRFALIESGVAVGLGLSMREAARRDAEPNGGVRNLIVSGGTWDGSPPPTRTLDVRRLRSMSIDPHTGDASCEIAIALDREGTAEKTITGGTVRLDLVAVLSRARRSVELVRRGAYIGPAALWIDDVELLS